MKTKIFSIFTIALFSHIMLMAENTIHLITVADTKDITINESVENNLIRINRHVKRIAEQTEMTITKYIFKGDSANTEIIWYSLEKLQFDSTDVVLFHYSGHGSNYYGEYPTLHLKGNFTLSLEQIHTVLSSKSARLVVTLADCCNASNNQSDAFWRSGTADNITSNQNKNLNYLFKESKGNILACSSKKGTVSYYNNNLGGYFTLALFEAIRNESEENVLLSWETVLQTTKQLTNQVAKGYRVNQTPHYDIVMNGQKSIINEDITSPIRITIKKGDNLHNLSKKYNVSIADLKKWNKLSSTNIIIGKTLIVFPSVQIP